MAKKGTGGRHIIISYVHSPLSLSLSSPRLTREQKKRCFPISQSPLFFSHTRRQTLTFLFFFFFSQEKKELVCVFSLLLFQAKGGWKKRGGREGCTNKGLSGSSSFSPDYIRVFSSSYVCECVRLGLHGESLNQSSRQQQQQRWADLLLLLPLAEGRLYLFYSFFLYVLCNNRTKQNSYGNTKR